MFFAIAVCTLTACKTQKPGLENSEENKPFRGTGWELVEAFGEPILLPDRSKIPFFTLNTDGNLFSGNTACNQIFGKYVVSEEGFAFMDVASTEMYCESTAQIELDFINVMQQVQNYEVKGSELIFYKGEEVLARFKALQQIPGQE
jgi:heat shock protein HslJ